MELENSLQQMETDSYSVIDKSKPRFRILLF
jgi:hypothetical protein